MHHVGLRISFLVQSTHIYTHAAYALFRPAHNWMFQEDDFVQNTGRFVFVCL